MEILEGAIAGWLGLIGLIGLAGLAGLKYPVDREREGAGIRLLGLLGLLGIAGFWIPGAGAAGALGALGLWNHQKITLRRWAYFGWAELVGIPFIIGSLL